MIPSTIANYYKLHAPFYDATRWSFLFGRNSIEDILPNLDRYSSILDIGCGTGKVTSMLSNSFPNCSITGIDSSFHMLKKARLKKLLNVQWIEEEFGQQGGGGCVGVELADAGHQNGPRHPADKAQHIGVDGPACGGWQRKRQREREGFDERMEVLGARTFSAFFGSRLAQSLMARKHRRKLSTFGT